MTQYAAETKVPIEKTRGEIEADGLLQYVRRARIVVSLGGETR